MKELLIIILTLTAFKTYSQEGKYEYSDFDCYESFEIKSDSFIYKHSCGLTFGKITGRIQKNKGTLILNSDIQPSFLLNESYESLLNSDTIAVVIKNIDFPNQYGLRVLKNEGYYDLNLQDSGIVRLEYDSLENSTSYYFSSNLFSKKEKLTFILYRTNLRIEIDWKDTENNKFEIIFNELTDVIDYHFFINKRAIIENQNLLLLDKEGKHEMTHYLIKTKKKIKMSKKKKEKKYKKST